MASPEVPVAATWPILRDHWTGDRWIGNMNALA
jgi:hypothetical protein